MNEYIIFKIDNSIKPIKPIKSINTNQWIIIHTHLVQIKKVQNN